MNKESSTYLYYFKIGSFCTIYPEGQCFVYIYVWSDGSIDGPTIFKGILRSFTLTRRNKYGIIEDFSYLR